MVRSGSLGLSIVLLALGSLSAEETPKAIIERAIKEMGGPKALESQQARYMKLEGTVAGAPVQGQIKMLLETRSMTGNKNYSGGHIDFGGNKIDLIHITNGDKGWSFNNGEYKEMSAEELKERDQSAHEDRVAGLVALLEDPAYTLVKIDNKKVMNRPAFGIRVSCKMYPDVKLYFDQETGLVTQMISSKKRGGETNEEISTLSDYRVVDFLKETEAELKEAKIGTGSQELLAYLAKQTPNPESLKRVKELVQQIGDDQFEVREKASAGLLELGPIALPLLRKAAQDTDPEVVRRAKDAIKAIEEINNPEMVIRAVRLLGLRKNVEAVGHLLELAPGASAPLLMEIRVALLGMAQDKSALPPALEHALQDARAEIRSTAEAVLAKDGGKWLEQPGRPCYPTNIKLPYTMSFKYPDGMIVDVKMTAFQEFNRFEERWFSPPK